MAGIIISPVSVSNTTVESPLLSNVSIPPTIAQIAGATLDGFLTGLISNKNLTAGTLTIRLKLGNVVIATFVVTFVDGQPHTNVPYEMHSITVVRVPGVSGQSTCFLLFTCPALGNASDAPAANFAIDTTISNTISITAQFSVADIRNKITAETGVFALW